MLTFDKAYYLYTTKDNMLDVACDTWVDTHAKNPKDINLFADEDNINVKNYEVDVNSGKLLQRIICL